MRAFRLNRYENCSKILLAIWMLYSNCTSYMDVKLHDNNSIGFKIRQMSL